MIKKILIKKEVQDISNRGIIWSMQKAASLPVWPQGGAKLIEKRLKLRSWLDNVKSLRFMYQLWWMHSKKQHKLSVKCCFMLCCSVHELAFFKTFSCFPLSPVETETEIQALNYIKALDSLIRRENHAYGWWRLSPKQCSILSLLCIWNSAQYLPLIPDQVFFILRVKAFIYSK
jgi:hypothetical protein